MDVTVTPSPNDVTVGPLTWPGLRGWANAWPADYGYGDDDGNYKLGAEVRAGAEVTVTVGPEARTYAGLSYGQRWSYSPAESVTFHGCPYRDTAYIGGFQVKGKRCVPFDIQVGDASPVRVWIGFFAPCPR
ncbi:hypothetical protein [Micromonospora zhanjiangensis]|uniref:Uncharacterized protein n=1 Tax=Micromonospora zhanjiangensis TaxID=1522057 RepID=A0ABV8KGJ5_9ACTN